MQTSKQKIRETIGNSFAMAKDFDDEFPDVDVSEYLEDKVLVVGNDIISSEEYKNLLLIMFPREVIEKLYGRLVC